MAFDEVAQEQQQSITILFVCFPVMLVLTQLALCQENVSKTEPGVAKTSFVKVNGERRKQNAGRRMSCLLSVIITHHVCLQLAFN